MRKILFFSVLSLLIIFKTSLHAKVQNKIILKIDNQVISTFDIKNKIKSSLVLSNQEINQKNINRIKSQSLDALINLNLKKSELTKYSFQDDDNQINNYLNSISSNDIAALKKKFQINDLDFDVFVDEIKTELNWQKLIFSKFNDKIKIDEKTVNDEIQRIIKEQNDIIEYRISEIEIFSENNEIDKKKIFEVNQQIKEIGFEAAAVTYSISNSASSRGDLGWINSKSLSENFSDQISKMNVGDVSKPFYNQNSIVILKLANKRVLKNKDINTDELGKKIINQKKNELFNLYSKSFLSKIKNTSFIEFK